MSSSGAWGPAPPGVDLTENQNASIIGSVVVITILGLLAVALRLFARLSRTGPGLAEDDYLVLIAAVGSPMASANIFPAISLTVSNRSLVLAMLSAA
jgi:hypothetical protein